MQLPTIDAIWIGRELGSIHVNCLLSFLRHGHRVVLHVYEEPIDSPSGLQLADACELLPGEMIFRNLKTGSYAPFSDLLRYEILHRGLGLYVDCEVYCLIPFPTDSYFFCGDKVGLISNGVLRLPPDEPVTIELASMRKTPNFVPTWYSKGRLLEWRLLQLTGRNTFDRLHVLAFGPPALTYYLRKHRLHNKAIPRDTNLPNISTTSQLLDPSISLADIVTNR